MRDAIRGPRVALGTITPSGNVVVERVTTAILRSFPEASGHFSRIEVVGNSDKYPDSYDWDGMMTAATLLSHAGPAAIVWNGSRGGGIGFEFDRDLCDRIHAATGVRASTSTLAIEAVLKDRGWTKLGLVTPYRPAYAAKIAPVFARAGLRIAGQAHAGLADNLGYAAIPDEDIAEMVREVAQARPDAIVTYCTNLPAAHLVAELEAELGIPVIDSTSIGVWAALRLAGIPTAPGAAWGQVFGLDLTL